MKPTILSIAARALVAFATLGCGKSADQRAEVTVPTGTTITLALNEPLSTDTHEPGYEFSARTTEAVVIDGKTVIPAGTVIRGEVKSAKSGGDNCGIAEMTLAFEQVIDASGKEQELPAEPLSLVGDLSQSGPSPGEMIVANGTVPETELTKSLDDDGEIVVAMSHDQLELEAGQKFAIELSDPLDIDVNAAKKDEPK